MRTFTYEDGIVEGMLIELGFYAIGKSMFCLRTEKRIYIVTYPEKGNSRLEVFAHLPGTQDYEEEVTSYVERVRYSSMNLIDVFGSIHNIIDVARIVKKHFDPNYPDVREE